MGTQLAPPNKRARKSVVGNNLNRTTGSSQVSRNSQQSQRGNFYKDDAFLEALRKAGVTISPHLSPQENPVLEISMNDVIVRMSCMDPIDIQLIIPKLYRFCEDKDRLQILLSATKIKDEHFCSDSQDSVLCILFRVESIQSKVGILLLDKLKYFQDDFATWKLIHAQIRMPEHIVFDELFFDKLLHTIHTIKGPAQSALIETLPEIVLGYEQHERSAAKLLEIVEEDISLVKPCLAALSLLDIKAAKNIQEIRNKICQEMQKYSAQDLPAVVTFLFKTCDVGSINQIISMLRSDDLNLFGKLSDASTCQRLKIPNRFEIIVLIELRRFFRLQSNAVLIETLSAVCSGTTFNVFDLIFLLVGCDVDEMDLLGNTAFGKIPSALLRKIPDFSENDRAIEIVDDLLSKTFSIQELFLYRDFYNFVVAICGQFLKSGNVNKQKFGALMLQHIFVQFNGEVGELEIPHMTVRKSCTMVLLSHMVGSEGVSSDVAIDALFNIIRTSPMQIAKFSVQFTNLFDSNPFFIRIPLDCMRKVFEMLIVLGRQSHNFQNLPQNRLNPVQACNAITEKLTLFIEKSLVSQFMKYKCVGLVASLTMLKLFNKERHLTDKERATVKKLLSTVDEECSRSPLLRALYMEEMSRFVENQPEHIRNAFDQSDEPGFAFDQSDESDFISNVMVKTNLFETFKNQFLIRRDQIKREYESVTPRLLLGEGEYAINLLGLIMSADIKCADKLIGLVGHMQLLYDMKMNGNIQKNQAYFDIFDLDIVICNEDTIETLKQCGKPQFVKKICTLLFHCADWLRQILSLYCEKGITGENTTKCIKMLDALVYTEKTLIDCLNYSHKFPIPVVWCLSQETDVCISGPSDHPISVKRKRAKANKRKDSKKRKTGDAQAEPETVLVEEEPVDEDVAVVVEVDGAGKSKGSKDLAPTDAPKFLREISLLVHSMMQIQEKLEMDSFSYLLKDLNSKIGHVLPGCSRRGRPPSKPTLNKDNFEVLKVMKRRDSVRFREIICGCTQAVVKQLSRMKPGQPNDDRSFDADPNETLLTQCLTFLLSLFKSLDVRYDIDWRDRLIKCFHSNSSASLEELLGLWIDLLISFVPIIDHIPTGSAIVQLCLIFDKWGDLNRSHSIGEIAEKFIETEFNHKVNNVHLKSLIEARIKTDEDAPLNRTYAMAVAVLELTDNEANESNFNQSIYKSFSSLTFSTYVSVFLDQLVANAKSVRHENLNEAEANRKWSLLVKLTSLIVAVYVLPSNTANRDMVRCVRRTYRMLVRHCVQFLKYFLDKRMGPSASGFDQLISLINSDNTQDKLRDFAITTIKRSQQIGRNLNQISNHLKKSKSQVAKLGELKEMLIVLNNRVEWALKNICAVRNDRVKERNLQGESQVFELEDTDSTGNEGSENVEEVSNEDHDQDEGNDSDEEDDSTKSGHDEEEGNRSDDMFGDDDVTDDY